MRLTLIAAILAVAVIAVLWVTGIIPEGELAGVAGKTFASLAIILAAALLLRLVRGRGRVSDRTDKPVP